MESGVLERIAGKVVKGYVINKAYLIDAHVEATRIVGKIGFIPYDDEKVGKNDFENAEKAFKECFSRFAHAKNSVCMRDIPITYFSSSRKEFYCDFYFDTIRGAIYTNKERTEEIVELVNGGDTQSEN